MADEWQVDVILWRVKNRGLRDEQYDMEEQHPVVRYHQPGVMKDIAFSSAVQIRNRMQELGFRGEVLK